MRNKIFNHNIKDTLRIANLQDFDYEIISLELGGLVNTYTVRQELYSIKFWELLKKYNISEENMIIHTEIDIDEKHKTHKTFSYLIKLTHNNNNFYISFFDEVRGYDDSDYNDFATEEDKENKISSLKFYYSSNMTFDEIEELVNEALDCSYLQSKENQFFTIQTTQYGFQLKASYVKKLEINLALNYGEKFVEVNDKIIDKLKNTKQGLFIFHGSPGTGKTSYIRKLISELSDKTIIYVPTYMMSQMADPELITFISQFKDTILILEDSENVLANTIDNRSQAVSNILNMTDGLLNDSMEVQIIATFNTSKKLIDKALTRAGRLQVDYKFGKLNQENAQKLIDHLDLDKKAKKPMSLAEIYEGQNQLIVDDLNADDDKKIGFS
jgi:hypothetical protein